MDKIYFQNEYKNGTPVPKVIWWYAITTNYKGAVNAEYCNNLLNNQLNNFFNKYPNELNNPVSIYGNWQTNITEQDKEFYSQEIKIKEDI